MNLPFLRQVALGFFLIVAVTVIGVQVLSPQPEEDYRGQGVPVELDPKGPGDGASSDSGGDATSSDNNCDSGCCPPEPKCPFPQPPVCCGVQWRCGSCEGDEGSSSAGSASSPASVSSVSSSLSSPASSASSDSSRSTSASNGSSQSGSRQSSPRSVSSSSESSTRGGSCGEPYKCAVGDGCQTPSTCWALGGVCVGMMDGGQYDHQYCGDPGDNGPCCCYNRQKPSDSGCLTFRYAGCFLGAPLEWTIDVGKGMQRKPGQSCGGGAAPDCPIYEGTYTLRFAMMLDNAAWWYSDEKGTACDHCDPDQPRWMLKLQALPSALNFCPVSNVQLDYRVMLFASDGQVFYPSGADLFGIEGKCTDTLTFTPSQEVGYNPKCQYTGRPIVALPNQKCGSSSSRTSKSASSCGPSSSGSSQSGGSSTTSSLGHGSGMCGDGLRDSPEQCDDRVCRNCIPPPLTCGPNESRVCRTDCKQSPGGVCCACLPPPPIGRQYDAQACSSGLVCDQCQCVQGGSSSSQSSGSGSSGGSSLSGGSSSSSSSANLQCRGGECLLGGSDFCRRLNGSFCREISTLPCIQCVGQQSSSSAARGFSSFGGFSSAGGFSSIGGGSSAPRVTSSRGFSLIVPASSSRPYVVIPCTDASQCLTGLCRRGFCAPCESDIECPSGICDEATGTCTSPLPTPECQENSDCRSNQCDDITKQCIEPQPCSDPSQCISGLCFQGICTACQYDTQCGSGICEKLTGQCRPRNDGQVCTDDQECASNLCMNGRCDLCTDNGQCRSLACDEARGRCQPPCDSDLQCDTGRCVVGACLPCNQDSDCTNGMCNEVMGQCVPHAGEVFGMMANIPAVPPRDLPNVLPGRDRGDAIVREPGRAPVGDTGPATLAVMAAGAAAGYAWVRRKKRK